MRCRSPENTVVTAPPDTPSEGLIGADVVGQRRRELVRMIGDREQMACRRDRAESPGLAARMQSRCALALRELADQFFLEALAMTGHGNPSDAADVPVGVR